MRLYGEIIHELKLVDYRPTGAQTIIYLTCTMIFSEDLARYGISRAEEWVSVDPGTMTFSVSLHTLNVAR